MSGSETSTTSSDTAKAFAGLRFKGDRLEPGRLTKLLGTQPTTAYRKDEIYKESRGHQARGRTGIWLLSTRNHVASSDLHDHLLYLLDVLFADRADNRVRALQDLLCEDDLEAEVICFWRGKSGSESPSIPEDVVSAFGRLPARIEKDFHNIETE